MFGDKSLPPELGGDDMESDIKDVATRLTQDNESSSNSPAPCLNRLKIDDEENTEKQMNWDATNGGGDIIEASDERLSMKLGAIGGVDTENTEVDESQSEEMTKGNRM